MKIIGQELQDLKIPAPVETTAEKFCEKNAKNGKLGMILGKNLLEKTGFTK